ncbi:hypothetical protein ADLP1_143 [Acinetobacter phage vB_AbaM_DLP1]|nr:hypothetical protein ADLP1_143 [Acinetobacter phage vB_AbaM_DLP1]
MSIDAFTYILGMYIGIILIVHSVFVTRGKDLNLCKQQLILGTLLFLFGSILLWLK